MRTRVFNILAIAILAILSTPIYASAQTPTPTPTPTPTNKKVTTPVKKGIVVQPSKVEYKKPTPTVKAVHRLPATSVKVSNKGVDFHISNGRYYRHDAGRYVAVAPPKGLRVRTLPVGYTLVKLLNMSYYYHEGVYYQQSGSEYIVVDAPEDIIVKTLPEETELISYEGKEYYIYGGDIYSIVITPDGKAFKKVGELGI